MLTQTKAERIVELLGIISNKSKRIKRFKIERGQQATKICVLDLRIKELERRLLEHLKGHSLEAVCDDCSSHYWYVDDELIVCPHCRPEKALKG